MRKNFLKRRQHLRTHQQKRGKKKQTPQTSFGVARIFVEKWSKVKTEKSTWRIIPVSKWLGSLAFISHVHGHLEGVQSNPIR